MKTNMSNNSLVNYDSKSDIIYIVTKEGSEEEFIEIAPGINMELDENGEVIGIEILNASEFLKPIVKSLYEHIQVA
jgi:uncharacterized protein YuzE